MNVNLVMINSQVVYNDNYNYSKFESSTHNQSIMQKKSLQQQQQSEYSYFIKGSGTSHCLINKSIEDQEEFVKFKFKEFLNEQDKSIHVKNISMAGLYLIVLLNNGHTYKLGSFNNHSEIFKIPIMIFNNKIKIQKVSSGWDHSIFMTQDKKFWGLGSNKFGQLPHCQAKRYHFQPQKLQFPKHFQTQKVSQFSCGFRQSYFATTNTNEFFGCGESKKYQLGQKSTKPISFKKLGTLNSQIKSISCSKRSVFVLTQQHQLYSIGMNQFQIFNQQQQYLLDNKQFLQQLTKINTNVRQLSCGWNHIILIKQKQKEYWIESYGRNNFYQLGRQKGIEVQSSLVDIKIDENTEITCGSQFSFLNVKNKIYGWGWNEHQNIISTKQQVIHQPTNIQYPSQQTNKYCTKIWTYPAITIIQVKKST